ncbi:vitamin D3 receptor [Lingula anatina]|uniref:Vitamin D3 receptor n=1 Tax=Lingula anatina TaxID=7574 RepID=A0A1S3I3S1_LINAN|nr:vitamin D3 receptor [Lingula anatina]|eukprot:XP_013392883.1 vitamin D3 receptor [Lingula anatina]
MDGEDASCSESPPYLPDSSSQSDKGMKLQEPKRRNRSVRQQGELTCCVCRDRAFGYNFGAITCESCKAFFRRNAQKSRPLKCNFDSNCTLDKFSRKFCTKCRLDKCLEMGMKKDWILNEEQLKKRKKIAPRKRKSLESCDLSVEVKPEPTDLYSQASTSSGCTPIASSQEYFSSDNSNSSSDVFKPDTISADKPIPLSQTNLKLLKELEDNYNRVLNSPYSESVASRLTETPSSHGHLYNMADTFIRRLIKFCKTIPYFRSLCQEDQIALLKGGIMCILMLRGAMMFNPGISAFTFSRQNETAQSTLKVPSLLSSNETDFFCQFHRLAKNDLKTMLCLLLIEIFSPDRPGLGNLEIVSTAQETFAELLHRYLESIYPLSEARKIFPKLIMKLVHLRERAEEASKKASEADIHSMEPLMVEIFSLQ